MSSSVEVDPVVRSNVVAWMGAEGTEWLAQLPHVLERLEEQWQVSNFGPPFTGGSHSLVVPCERNGGQRCVLKVTLVDEENRGEPDALRLYAGEGANFLHEFDEASGAMLLERLEPGGLLMDLADTDQAVDIACSLLRRLRRPVPVGHPFPLVIDAASRWHSVLVEQGQSLSKQDAKLAAAAAERALQFSRDQGANLLVNRDAHRLNFVAATREPWLLIDPKPLVGGAAFDAGYLVDDLIGAERDASSVQRLTLRVADGLAVDVERVRGWALVRAMDNVLWAAEVGLDSTRYLQLAQAIIDIPD